jgi:polyisoprenyl-teichoic acid--peptidoglycan teichoic acid transferase
LRMSRTDLIALVFTPSVLTSVFVINLIVLAYRLVAIIDAYRVAEFLNRNDASGDGRVGQARRVTSSISLAGLLAIILVMTGSHVVIAHYDSVVNDVLTDGCIFQGDDITATCNQPDATDNPSDSSDGSDIGDSGDGSDLPSDSPTPEPTLIGTPVPNVVVPPWNGTDRLNILLLGVDEQGGGFNTDTMITISIDPVTKQVAMFSLPRDTTNVPVPPGPARSVWGSVYGQKINSWYSNNKNRSDLWSGKGTNRGYTALKAILGNLYGLNIRYYVKVNFAGFKQIVDTMGGVTVNVQVPVVDDTYPASNGDERRLYIPTGLQHMDGAQALQYARSRHGKPGHSSTDFDRAARQQRLLLSLREQADPQQLIPKLPALIDALQSAVKTDVPLDQLAELLGLASSIDTSNIRSYVFSPPLYGSETAPGAPIYEAFPNVPAIRAAVKDAFSADPIDEAQREKLAEELASVWVVSGLDDRSVGNDIAAYLDYRGLAASAPRPKPAGSIPAHTRIQVYNGVQDDMSGTVAFLESTFGVKAELVTDPNVHTDIVVTVGRDTPDLKGPTLN